LGPKKHRHQIRVSDTEKACILMATPMPVIAVPTIDPAMISARRAQQKRAQELLSYSAVELPPTETTTERTTERTRLRILVTLQMKGAKYSTGVCGNGEKVFIDKKYVKHFSQDKAQKCDIRETPGKKMPWKCMYVHKTDE